MGGGGLGRGGAPPPKTFFQFSFFFATYDQKIAFWRPINFWSPWPLPPKKLPSPNFFHFIGSRHRIPIMFRWTLQSPQKIGVKNFLSFQVLSLAGAPAVCSARLARSVAVRARSARATSSPFCNDKPTPLETTNCPHSAAYWETATIGHFEMFAVYFPSPKMLKS